MQVGKSGNMASRDEDLVLSNLPPSRTQQKLALVVALLIVVCTENLIRVDAVMESPKLVE
jgi:hypothetical protein